MFRLFFLIVAAILIWLIVNSVLRAIIRAFGGYRPPPQRPMDSRPRSGTAVKEKFRDIQDADFTDIDDDKKPKP